MVRLLDLKPGKEDNEAAMSLSSSQELCPVVYTGPDASLLPDCGYASEGPSKATQSPFLPESPVGLPESWSGSGSSSCFPVAAAQSPGLEKKMLRDRVDVTRGAS